MWRGCCYPARTMDGVLRYLLIGLALFGLAVVLLACGDAAGETCLHACCIKSDQRLGGLTSMVCRILNVQGECARALGASALRACRNASLLAGNLGSVPPGMPQGLQLRI